jgi:hypothetical protein
MQKYHIKPDDAEKYGQNGMFFGGEPCQSSLIIIGDYHITIIIGL